MACIADGKDGPAEARRLMARALLEGCEGDGRRLVVAGGGDLAIEAAERIVGRSLAGRPVKQRATLARMAEIRAELEGDAPSPIERLLAERAALCWLHPEIKDLLSIQAEDDGHERAENADRLRTRAHSRYVGALKTPASIRKMKLTAIQVNLGHGHGAEAAGLRAMGGE